MPERSQEIVVAPSAPSADPPDGWQRLLSLVLDSVSSPHTRRAYRDALAEFAVWCRVDSNRPFTRSTVHKYRAELQDKGLAPSSINLRLSAIRKLAQEASENSLLRPDLAAGILRIRGTRRRGIRVGQWLTREQAESLLAAPAGQGMKDRRDRALLAILIGAGLRRSEAVAVTIDHIQQRDGRWVVADLVGKHERIRTVPIAGWTKEALDVWIAAADIRAGLVFRRVTSGGHVLGCGITPQTVFDIVRAYSGQIGIRVAPHDLRRTFARLAYRGHAKLEQVQLALGHASLTTTEVYLGVSQDLQDAPCDYLGIRSSGSADL